MRRIPYRSVNRLTIHQRRLVIRVVLLALLGLILGGLMLLTGEFAGQVMAGILFTLFGTAAAYYALARRTTLIFEHGRQKRTCKVITLRSKIDRFIQRFTTAVNNAQTHERERRG